MFVWCLLLCHKNKWVAVGHTQSPAPHWGLFRDWQLRKWMCEWIVSQLLQPRSAHHSTLHAAAKIVLGTCSVWLQSPAGCRCWCWLCPRLYRSELSHLQALAKLLWPLSLGFLLHCFTNLQPLCKFSPLMTPCSSCAVEISVRPRSFIIRTPARLPSL